MTTACDFLSLGEKMRELLDKNGKRKRKEKRKITDHIIERFHSRDQISISSW